MVSCIVIDDDQTIVDLFCELLKVFKLDILATGNNGKEAITLYEKHSPDIVFTDMSMPEYDGLYAIENIKDVDLNAKIVLITGDTSLTDSYLLDSLNIPVILKPFDLRTIKQVIENVYITENDLPVPFEIQYKFKEDENIYSCVVNYTQYRNLKKLPVTQECKIINIDEKNKKLHLGEMEKALDSAINNDTSHIRKLSEITSN